MAAGRPTKYEPKFCEQVRKLCLLGLTDKELAKFFDIGETTLNRWKKDYPEFRVSISSGKVMADADVTDSLFRSAMGYSHADVHIAVIAGKIRKTKIIKHYPPVPTSVIFWLRNRRKENWRNQIEPTDTGDAVPEAVKFTFEVIDGRKNVYPDSPAG